MASFRLTRRRWRIYLTVWLVALAAVAGALVGIAAPRLFAKPPPPPSLSGGVILNPAVQAPSFALRDQQGVMISPAGLRGRVIALTFLDTQCLTLCPLQASLLGTVQADLGSGGQFSVVVVSVHPEADTPASIATFAGAHGLKGGYHWLSGTRQQLSSVWDSYGVGVQVANGDLLHSSIIYLIDRGGHERVAFADVPDLASVESDVRVLEAG
ncbi:MAG: SCO family protein [Candidatus Dormibacteraceae bacterium]